MMPRMSGDQMVEALRNHPEMADTPIIMLTAKADDTLRVKLLKERVQITSASHFPPKNCWRESAAW